MFSTYLRVLSSDTLARLSVYTVPSSAASYTSLLPHFLPPRSSLPHTVIVIVLDWTRPWTFMDELHTWLTWVEQWVQSDDSRELVITREENHERRKSMWRFFQCSDINTTSCSTSTSTVLYRALVRTSAREFYTARCSPSLRPGNTNA